MRREIDAGLALPMLGLSHGAAELGYPTNVSAALRVKLPTPLKLRAVIRWRYWRDVAFRAGLHWEQGWVLGRYS